MLMTQQKEKSLEEQAALNYKLMKVFMEEDKMQQKFETLIRPGHFKQAVA